MPDATVAANVRPAVTGIANSARSDHVHERPRSPKARANGVTRNAASSIHMTDSGVSPSLFAQRSPPAARRPDTTTPVPASNLQRFRVSRELAIVVSIWTDI